MIQIIPERRHLAARWSSKPKRRALDAASQFGSGLRCHSQSVHWFTVALVVVAWFLGTFGDDLPRGSARDVGMFVRVTAGLLIIALLVVRVLWRLVDAPQPASMKPLLRRMSSKVIGPPPSTPGHLYPYAGTEKSIGEQWRSPRGGRSGRTTLKFRHRSSLSNLPM